MNDSIPSLFLIVLPEDLSGLAGVLAVIGFFLLVSWLICVAAAFCRVKEVQYPVGMLATGTSLLMAFLLVGLCRSILPDLAASFTDGGLFLLAAVAGSLVCSVPLIQYFWNLSYRKGLLIVSGAVGILVSSLVFLHLLFYPAENLPARFSMPLFQDHQPGLLK